MTREGNYFYWEWRRPEPEDFGFFGLFVRFVVTIAALWVAQWLVTGFDIHTFPALLFGSAIFGLVNAVIRPIVSCVTCLLTIITFGLFTLIINTMMLGLTAWVAGLFDISFEVDGFIAAFLGALVISVVSTMLNWWTTRNVLAPLRDSREW